ncbi:MAG: EthD family reductase [Deltaproteobacteria bacterium]|nr:EthD family reductase [Deltaproteobacteria bacterium]
MVKIVICVTRKAGLTWEEFDSYWKNHHSKVVTSVPEFTRHVRKYTQCHLVKGALPLGAAGQYDGIAELWFDSVAALETAFNEPRYLEIIRPDELKFADLGKCLSFITEEVHVM